MATSKLQIVIDAIGAGKAKEEIGGLSDTLGKIGGFATKAAGGVAAVGAILKQAFDFGEAGAQMIQTRESFDLLIQKVGASPNLFNDLKAAAGGTITELELMSSTSTLLAGAQGDLATELAGSTPKLLEIARAANKLNPSLGDTTFLYDSLATGIKRASPLILDNLGLTVKVGEANEKYAEQLGKSVEQLTAEEQKMALLNATLEAGDVLIDQVGGNVESATDDFARLDTAVTEIGQEMQQVFVPVLADAAMGALGLINGVQMVSDALAEQEQRMIRAAIAGDDLDATTQRITGGYSILVSDAAQVKSLVFQVGNEMENKGTPAAVGYAGALAEAAGEVGAVEQSLGNISAELTELSQEKLGREALQALNDYAQENQDFSDADYASTYRDIASEFTDLNPQQVEANIQLGRLQRKWEAGNATLPQYIQNLKDVAEQLGNISQFAGGINIDVGAGGGQFTDGLPPIGPAGGGDVGLNPGGGGQ